MNFPYITRVQGFFLSTLCILLYNYGFYQYHIYWMDRPPTIGDWDARIFFVGSIIHMMYYLPRTGILVFCAKTVEGGYWEEGLCFAPNLLHFTVYAFGFPLLWGVKLLGEPLMTSSSKVLVEVFKDQQRAAMPNYNYNVSMSHAAANVDRAMNSFAFWLFGWKRGEPHLVLMRFGFRLILIALIWTTVAGITVYTKHKTDQAVEGANQLWDRKVQDLGRWLSPQ